MLDLRLTCRAVCQITYNSFAKAAFSNIFLNINSRALNRLLQISRHDAFAEHVCSISIDCYERFSRNEYVAAREIVTSPEVSARERRKALGRVRRADLEHDDKDFLERFVTVLRLTPKDGAFRPRHLH